MKYMQLPSISCFERLTQLLSLSVVSAADFKKHTPLLDYIYQNMMAGLQSNWFKKKTEEKKQQR